MFEFCFGVAGYCLMAAILVHRSAAADEGRRAAKLAKLPELLQRLSAQLAAGSSLNQGLQSLVQALDGATHESLRGSQWVSQLALQLRSPDLENLATLIGVLEREGGDPFGHLEALGARLRVRARARSMAVVAMAPVKGQARLVLFVMPVLVLMVFALEPDATLALFTTGDGLSVLGLCVALNAAIWLTFQRMGRVPL